MLDTCVILNGPPGCGKDTIAKMMAVLGFHHHQMKEQLYRDTADYFHVDLLSFKQRATDRNLKEMPWDLLAFKKRENRFLTPREALIHVSENIIKPYKGTDYFGLAAAGRCVQQKSNIAVFSDGGFQSEVPPLAGVYNKVVVIRLHRGDCNYDKDSREYLQGFDNTFDINLEYGRPHKGLFDVMEIVLRFANIPM